MNSIQNPITRIVIKVFMLLLVLGSSDALASEPTKVDLTSKIKSLEEVQKVNRVIEAYVNTELSAAGAEEFRVRSLEKDSGPMPAIIAGTRLPFTGPFPDPYVLTVNTYTDDMATAEYDFGAYLFSVGHEANHHRRSLIYRKFGKRTSENCADYYAAQFALPMMKDLGSPIEYLKSKESSYATPYAKSYCKDSEDAVLCAAGVSAVYGYVSGMNHFYPEDLRRPVALEVEETEVFVPGGDGLEKYPTLQCRLDLMKRAVKCVSSGIALETCELPVCLASDPALLNGCR